MAGAAPAPAPPRPTAQAAEPAREAVRKTVTVLFCDLVGSTAFAEAVDTESAREAMGRYHAMAQATVEANDGTVAKFIGDGVMALFGVPEVAEDDAERAVLTGRALQRGFVPIREHVANRYGVEVGLRVGINTGEVVIDDADADLVGDVLNTAARLEAQCVPGEVLVGEDTWRLTRSMLEYQALGEVTVKGKRDGLATFQLVTADDGAATDAADLAELAIPFVGRDSEIAQLRSVLDDAVAAGEARLATVIGSPGVGKTRLARELGRTVGDDARFVELRCERAGTATFEPIAELLQTVADFDDATPDEIVESLRTLVGGAEDADRLVELLGSFVGTAAPRSTEDAFFAVRRLVEILGERQPLALVIDDIQWAEPLFLDLLEHLAQWAKAAPVLVIGLARPEIRDIRPPLTETGRRVSAVVSLEGLDAAATELLAAGLLGGAALPEELTARLPDSTNGNPLFVRELVRMLVDDGVIVQVGDRWDLAVDAEAIEVPPTIQSLLATRVERLPHAERRVLELASVVGPEFPLGALAALLPDTGGDNLDAVIERLRRKEQVEPTGTYWGDEPVIRFHHVLIRDAAYRRLLKGARADLHLEVGAWVEATSEHLTGDFDVVIAHHFEQAYLYRQQLNDDDASTTAAGRKAAALLHRAADAALQRDDLAAAGGYANRALATLGVDADEVPDLLLLACEAFLSSGDVGNGRALVKQLSDHAVGDDRMEAWTTCFEAQLSVLTEPDQLREASDRAADSAAQLQHLGDQAGVAKARIIRAQALARLGQVGAAEGELDLALTAARAAKDRRRITAVLSAAPVAALWGPSPVPRAGGRCLDVVRLSRITADSPEVEATSVRCQAVLEALRGRFDTARALLATARATTEKIGLRQGLLETRYFAGIVELLAGDPVAAEPHLRRAYGGLGQLGIGADAGQAAAYLARALLLQGRLDEADELAADSDALAGQNLQTAIAARSAQAEILAVRGETIEALALAEEAVRLAADTDIILDHGNALATLARVRAAHGDREGADRAASSANDLFTQKGATALVGTTRLSGQPPAATTVHASTPDATPATTHPKEPWNHADAHSMRASESFDGRDISSYADFVDESFTGFDHRKLLQHPIDSKQEWLELFRQMFSLTEGTFLVDREPVAARGDRMLLTRYRYRLEDDPDGPVIELLDVIDYLPNGKLTRSSIYDVEDLQPAIDELDGWYTAIANPLDDPFAFCLLASDRVITARQSDRMLRAFHPDIDLNDHRSIGFGALTDRDEAKERLDSWAILPDGFFAYTPRIRRSEGMVVLQEACFRVDGADGDVMDSRFLAVSRLDPGLGQVTNWEQFELDDAEAAIARYEALVAADDGLRTNDAVGVGALVSFSAHLASIETIRHLFADDFVARCPSTNDVTRIDLVEGRVQPEAIGFGVEYRKVVSVIGERLAMLFIEVEGGERRWSVEEIDEANRLARVRHFPAGSLVEATNHLEERWQAIEHAPAAVVVRHAYGLAARSAKAEMADLLAQDFSLVDHRPLGLGRLDQTAMLSFNARDNQGELGELTPLELHAASERAVVVSSAVVAVTDAGDLLESLVCTVLFAARDGKVDRIELFDEGNVGAAMARAAEIDPGGFAASTAVEALAPTDEPWNDADKWTREAHEIWITRGIDATARTIDEGFTSSDHRQGVRHEIAGRDEWANNLDVARGVFGRDWRSAYDTVATRGSLLVLHRITHTQTSQPEEPVLQWLQVGQWSNEGLQLSTVLFDADDLVAALFELDRRYLEAPAPDPLVVLGLLTDHAFMGRTPHKVHALMHRDVEIVDHRAIGWGSTVGREAVLDRFDSVTDLPEGFAYYAPRWVRSSALIGLFEGVMRMTGEEGAESMSTYLGVTHSDPATGLSTNWEQFEADDLDRATARFEELVAADASLLTNRAVVAGGLVNAIVWMDEGSQLANLLAPSFTAGCDAVSDTTISRDEFVDGAIDPTAIGFGVEHRQVVSVIGERLAMLYVETASGERRFSVEEIDEHGRLARVRQFPATELTAAIDALEERWRTIDGDQPAVAAMNSWERAARSADADEMARRNAEDFALVDHRPLGIGKQDRQEFLDGIDERQDELGVLTPVRLESVSDRVVVIRSAVFKVTSSDDLWEGLSNITVYAHRDGLTTNIELFDQDDFDGAMARAAELDPAGFASSTSADEEALTHEPWNEADQLHRASVRLLQAGDRAGWADMMADPITYADRRPMLGVELDSKQDYVDLILFGLDRNPRFAARQNTIAVRGDSHVLMTQHISGAHDPDGPFSEWLSLTEWQDGKCILSINFDPTDLESAISELNERYLDSIRVVDDPGAFTTPPAFRASMRREGNALAAAMHSDVEMVDHRDIGWPATSGRAAARRRLDSIADLPPEYFVHLARVRHAVGNRLILIEQVQLVTGNEGGQQESRSNSLYGIDPVTGLTTRSEQFDAGDFETASARFDSLLADDPDPMVNDAVTVGGLTNFCVRIGAFDHLHRVIAADLVAEGVGDGSGRVTFDDLVSGSVDPTSVGYGVEYRHVVSIVGDRLALLSVDTDSGRRWSVEELDDTGRLRRVTHFPIADLGAATAHLAERQDVLGPTNDAVRTLNRWFAAYEALDHDEVARLLADEFEFVDHRPLGGPADKADMVRFAADGIDAGLGVLLGRRLRHLSDHIVVGDSMALATTADDEFVEANVAITVIEVRNGQIRRFELFPEDELDRAIARAAELDPEGFAVAIAQTPLSGEHEPWNKADRMHRQLTNALEVGDLRQWRQLMADDLRVEDRRALLGHELSGLSDVETFYDDWQGRRHQCAATTIAARGNDLVLLDMRWTPADDPDGPVLEHLQLNRWDSGQLIHAITFDPDDLRAAIDELDRMYLATLDPVTAGEYRDTFRFLNHLSDGELEPVMAVQRPDTVMVDHRPLGWGTEQRYDELRERFRTLTESDNSITEYVRRFHHWSPHSICIAIRIVNESPEGARLIDDHIIVSRTDPATGLSMRTDQFDDAQLDEALVFVNATMAEIDAELPRANLAVRAGAVANLAARDGNLDDLFAILADDFTAELADGRTVTSDDIRAGRVAPTEIGYGITDRRIGDALVDRIALLSVAVPSNTRVWSIESLDDTGRIARVTHVSIADPATANREYSVRARELVDTGPLPTLIRFTIASQDLDTAALRDVLAPNFSFTDHRELGFGHADRETYIDLQATPPTDDPSLTTALRIPRIEALTDHVMVCRFKRMYLSPHGESWEAARGISVNLVRDGAQEVVELFDDDQLGAALARAAELDPEGFGDAAADMPEDGREPWNRADRLNRAASGHFFAGRTDAWAAMIADDYRGEQRRTLLGQDFTTKQDLETANRAMLELSAAPVAEIETLATRDDDLVLTHLRVTPADDPGGPLIDVLDLTQWNGDDQCIRTVTFDAEDVIAAIDELDRLAAPSLDPSLRGRLDLNRLIDDAIRARDLGRLVASVDPDVEWIDHRPLGWGVVSGLGGYRNRLSTLTKIDGTLVRYMRRFYDGGPETLVFECRSQVTSPEGSVSVDDHILVGTSDPGSGLTTHIEQFDRDEVEFAIQRSEELARSTRLPFALTQAVTIVANANASLRVGNLADFLAHLADDLVAVGVGPEQTTVGIAELRSGTMTPADLGFGGHDREVIAVRGQRLVLVRVGPLEPTGLARHWSLSEIDDDHRIARVELFDDQDLLGAVDALEERALELAEPPTMPDPIWRWEQAHRHLDVGALGALTSDDFTLVDHRPRGYEPMDKAAALAQFQSWADDEALRGVPVHTSTRAVGATACVQPGAIWLPREREYWIGNPFIAVITCRHDAVSRIELFGEDQLDDAMARANELDAFQARPEGWFHERTIDPVWLAERSESEVHAVDVALRFVDAVAAADVDALDAVVDPDFSTDDHRPVGWGPRSREAFLDAVRQRPATLGTGVAHGEFLLQIGPIGLIRYEVTTAVPETGGEVSEVGLGVMVVADGTVRWMELHAEADLAAAVVRTRELARLHQPNAGPSNRADRFARRNPALLGAEHATLETVLVRSDDHVLHRLVGPDAAEKAYVATHWTADGALVSRHDFDDSHEAQTHVDIACFDALGSAGTSGPILVEWGRVVRERDWERAAQLLAPEYRATSDQFLHSGGKATGEQLLTWFATEANQKYSRELVATEVHAVASVGGVISETDHYIDRDGSSFESSGAALITARDGMLTSATKSNEDKLPELLDELDRLAVEAGEQVAYLSETARALRSGRRSSADR